MTDHQPLDVTPPPENPNLGVQKCTQVYSGVLEPAPELSPSTLDHPKPPENPNLGVVVQTNVPPGLTNVVAIAAGASHSLALVGDGPPVLQRPVVNPAWDTNGFSVSVPTQNGRVYALEYKASPSGGNWTPLPLAAGAGGVLSLTDLTATNSQRFYRVRHR